MSGEQRKPGFIKEVLIEMAFVAVVVTGTFLAAALVLTAVMLLCEGGF